MRQKAPAGWESMAAYRRARYAARKAQDLCADCPRHAVLGKARCREHLAKDSAHAKRTRDAIKEEAE